MCVAAMSSVSPSEIHSIISAGGKRETKNGAKKRSQLVSAENEMKLEYFS